MITKLPDPKNYSKSNGPEPHENSVVFAHTTDQYFYPEHKTPYVFVTNLLNKGNYLLNRKHIQISREYFYFLNVNDELEINFNKSTPLQTLLILFNEKFIDDSLAYLTSPVEQSLDASPTNRKIQIPSVPFCINDKIHHQLLRLTQADARGDQKDAILFNLVSEFLSLNIDTLNQIKRIRAAKKSTQEELYKRLFVARQFMNDRICDNLTLDQIAQEVCMNKFHFLSNFKTLYNITPRQYIIEQKLQRTFQLLKCKRLTAAEVCLAVGFESVGTFSSLFKRRFHISPAALSRQE